MIQESSTKARAAFIDAHCHLSDPRMKDRLKPAIEEATTAGVGILMLGGVESDEWRRQAQLKRDHPEILRTSFGIHPWRVASCNLPELEQEFLVLEREIQNADALGETGLDFHPKRNPASVSIQEEFFARQLKLAEKARKPLVLHVVRAHARALTLVREANLTVPLMIHSFSGSAGEAREWVRIGAFLSFSGGIARKNPDASKKSKEALRATPLSRLLFETDSPDQAFCEGFHEPRLVIEVYRAASDILGVPLPELKEIVAENFAKIR
jgi:TatD DNase family protein